MFEEYSKEELILQAKLVNNDTGEEKWYPLGALIEKINHKSRDTDAFKATCTEIGIQWRQGFYLIALYRHFRHHDLQPPKGISWRTLIEVTLVLNWKNQDKIFALCREKKRSELREIINSWPRE